MKATVAAALCAACLPSPALGLEGGCQEIGFERVDVPPPTQGSIESSGDHGDGFEPLLVGRRVFNIWHHNHSKVQCSEMVRHAGVEGSQVCTGYGTESSPGYGIRVAGQVPRTSNANAGYADAASGRIIYPAALSGQSGFVCLDIPADGPPSACKATNTSHFRVDGFVEVASSGQNIGWGTPDYAKQRLYAVDWDSPLVYCLDVSNPADLRPCRGYPYSGHGFSTLRAAVMPGTDRVILTGYWKAACMETRNNTPSPCQGWPAKVSTPGNLRAVPIPILDEAGVALGFCQHADKGSVHCHHLSNGSAAVPGTALATAASKLGGVRLPNVSRVPHKNDFAHVSVFGTRTYYAVGAFNTEQGVVCYDGRTQDLCTNFPHAVNITGGIYALAADAAVNGTCVWSLGHGGVLSSFSAEDPSQPCSGDHPTVKVQPPCDAAEWLAVELSQAAFEYADVINVTIMDLEGSVVSRGELTNGSRPLSLAGIPVSGASAEITAKLEFVASARSAPRGSPQLIAKWVGCPSHCHGPVRSSVTATETVTTTATATETVTTTATATTTTTCELQRLEESLMRKKSGKAGPVHDHLRKKLAEHVRWESASPWKDAMRKDGIPQALGSSRADASLAGTSLSARLVAAGLVGASAVAAAAAWVRARRGVTWASASSAPEAHENQVLLMEAVE